MNLTNVRLREGAFNGYYPWVWWVSEKNKQFNYYGTRQFLASSRFIHKRWRLNGISITKGLLFRQLLYQNTDMKRKISLRSSTLFQAANWKFMFMANKTGRFFIGDGKSCLKLDQNTHSNGKIEKSIIFYGRLHKFWYLSLIESFTVRKLFSLVTLTKKILISWWFNEKIFNFLPLRYNNGLTWPVLCVSI